MSKDANLNECFDRIELASIEREATPRLLMKLSIQLHLAGLSLSNTVSMLELFGVGRARSTVHIGFTRPIYSSNLVGVRITSRSTRP